MIRDEEYKIELDLDRDRIKTILSECYDICKEYLHTEPDIIKDQFVSQIDPFLKSNRVSIPVLIDFPCKNYPGIKIEINLRRKKVMVRMFPKNKQAILNHLVGAL